MKKYFFIVLVVAALMVGLVLSGSFQKGKRFFDLTEKKTVTQSGVELKEGVRNSGAESSAARSRSAEYLLRFESVKNKALRGDSAAQLELSRMYDRCFPVSISREKYLASIDAMAAQAGEAAAAMKATAKRIADDCALVEGGSPIPLDAQKEWLAASAASGNLAAKIRLQVRYPDEAKESVSDLVKAAVNKKNPEAIFELTDLLATQSPEVNFGPFEAVAGDETSAYAWGIVACQMGADCGAGSAVVDGYCLNGACASNYEQLVRNSLLPRGEGERLNARIEYINSVIGRK
ncbi:hypothetical protein GIY21_06670 [Xanthomonas sontii]|uniref:Uncharacterized protein n=1 Tax=Xanthomonas sontii TaxID=2650745 RepID=A0A6N7QCM2_9XANT|nr:hypothetical protein [Xanthomonas sontii]MRG99974.1 hypothetical protein [Xanthomonas sontii]MRH74307.1 hypothetical protein [Xanthomonas sontii]